MGGSNNQKEVEELANQVQIQGSGSLNNSLIGGVTVANPNTMFAERHKQSIVSDEELEINKVGSANSGKQSSGYRDIET